jgi:YidC/Oxa1 family membrane protein insertase
MEQRNLLIAIVLSVGILIAFQFGFERLRPPQPPGPPGGAPVTAPATSGPATGSTPPAPAAASNPGTNAPGAAPARAAETRDAALAEQPRVKIDTPRLHGSIDLLGARLDDLTLANYHETVDPKSPEVVLLSPPGTQDPYLAELGWVAVAPDVKVPGPQTRWTETGGQLTPTNPVTLTWDNGQGLLFTRTISVDPNYMFTVRDAVRNGGTDPVKLLPYGLISRTGTPHVAGYYILHEGLIGYLGGSLQEVKYSSLNPGTPIDYPQWWLARLYRQILADVADSPQNEAVKARASPTRRRRRRSLPSRLSRPGSHGRARWHGGVVGPLLRRCEGSQPSRRLQGLGNSSLRPRHRFRLVLFLDQADFPGSPVLL